jgi:hypothetical protein
VLGILISLTVRQESTNQQDVIFDVKKWIFKEAHGIEWHLQAGTIENLVIVEQHRTGSTDI